ncbi:MAG: trehalose-phosphatase [Dehalococcoidia bacterium]
MPHILDHFAAVRELLLLSPFGLFTDVDGTISEIAPSPEEAVVSPVCQDSLASLSRHLAVVGAVSGRPAAEARRMVGVDEIVYLGNHGLERWVGGETELVSGAEDYPARIAAVLDELRSRISMEGVIFENKGPSASIHYRRCRDQEAALKTIMAAVDGLARASNLKVSLGRMVVELRPPLEVNKGTAVCSLIEERHLKGAMYLGDDITDVDVFVAFHQPGLPFKGISIGVVCGETSPRVIAQADFTANGVVDVERLLTQLVAEVAGRTGS